jgi:proteasome component ECM29
MATQQTTEARELQLVGSVEFRIAAANSDAKLEALLDKYLAPLLLKLASEHIAVRNKVSRINVAVYHCMYLFIATANSGICSLGYLHMPAYQQTHSSTSVGAALDCTMVCSVAKSPYREIKLPVKKLLVQFKEHADVPLIRHFDILYIQQGISRLPVSERPELLPILISGIATDYSKSAQHASQLFHLILRLLVHFKLPPRGTKEDTELRSTLQINGDDGAFLSRWFGKLILLSLTRQNPPGTTSRCPGLSTDEYSFLTLHGNPDAWDPSAPSGLNLIETKALAVRLLASGVFTDQEKFLPALFAVADTNSRVSEVGEDILKRVMFTTDLENVELIETLFGLYFGS